MSDVVKKWRWTISPVGPPYEVTILQADAPHAPPLFEEILYAAGDLAGLGGILKTMGEELLRLSELQNLTDNE